MSNKQKVLEALNKISDEATFEDIIYNLYIEYKIQEGIQAAAECNVKTTEEVRNIIDK